jgi:hypothetical protein
MTATSIRRMYIREAVLFLVIARIAVFLLPSDWMLCWAARPLKRARRFSDYEVDWVSWAVERAGAKRWINAVCLSRALAAQAMLRRRGIASRLCLGVAHKGNTLIAHAWVEFGSQIVVGGTARSRFTKLREFDPGSRG